MFRARYTETAPAYRREDDLATFSRNRERGQCAAVLTALDVRVTIHRSITPLWRGGTICVICAAL